jgi:hypothetical protein
VTRRRKRPRCRIISEGVSDGEANERAPSVMDLKRRRCRSARRLRRPRWRCVRWIAIAASRCSCATTDLCDLRIIVGAAARYDGRDGGVSDTLLSLPRVARELLQDHAVSAGRRASVRSASGARVWRPCNGCSSTASSACRQSPSCRAVARGRSGRCPGRWQRG